MASKFTDMIISRGWGILALLIPITTVLVGIFFFGENGNGTLKLFLYSLLCSAPLTFGLGVFLNRKSVHDLYFIRLQYWGLAWGVIALGILLIKGF